MLSAKVHTWKKNTRIQDLEEGVVHWSTVREGRTYLLLKCWCFAVLLILLILMNVAFQSAEIATWAIRQRRIKVNQDKLSRIRKNLANWARSKNQYIQHMYTGKHNFWYFHLFLIVMGSKDQIQNKNHLSKVVIGHTFLYYLVIRTERGIKYLSENLLQRKQWEPMSKTCATDKEQLTRNKLQRHF